MAIEHKLNEKQGHWILAKVGKKVLRPGGRELTNILMKNMQINTADDVVEFAPGLGYTAALACSMKPNSYTGIDNNKAASELAQKNVNYDKMKMIVADASDTTLPDACATKVYGEAMLTMQPLEHKKAIIQEASRILKPGGYYGIHEMGLQPDNISEDIKQSVYKDLSTNIRVHARPLTVREWCALLQDEGFEIVKIDTNAMALLEPKRVLQDEGLMGMIKMICNILTHAELRKRILLMRQTFRRHKNDINSVAIVARKR
ncbi:class I SAM-dependent methyltransferase [Sphingobacterium sp. DN00404]|uniref:Class I SAM-dependent methyltransferase n=1 Tax=Sphingobacterium micropteri TaxID=2763501 RepID=A0ABR7YJE1_9SPHI|nr:class I SAM-dependent methyltransferase [Sphingobacterium micropteri]MBD1431374.1 class I SAM-dependent methyltransferase [Sphingobacterium micropteri]